MKIEIGTMSEAKARGALAEAESRAKTSALWDAKQRLEMAAATDERRKTALEAMNAARMLIDEAERAERNYQRLMKDAKP